MLLCFRGELTSRMAASLRLEGGEIVPCATTATFFAVILAFS